MEKIKLYETEMYDGSEQVTLELFLHSPSPELTAAPRPAMLVLPGGGYAFCSDREAEPIATAYYAQGYNCFVLRYITGEKAKIGKPLLDAAAAMAHIRSNSQKYCVDTNRIAVIGFSAGGHLAGMLATQWHQKGLAEKLGVDSQLLKPNAAILSYPVISSMVSTHSLSFDNFLGADRDEELSKKACVELCVDDRTCPCFIWHTAKDSCVPVVNSLVLAEALTRNGISCELHIFPMGDHGLSRANAETSPDWSNNSYIIPYVARWVDWSVKWLEEILFNGNVSFLN